MATKPPPTSTANRGMAFEALLALQHRAYAAQGIALVEKVPTPLVARRNRDGGFDRPFAARKSVSDYLGVWSANGARALAVEAKECAQPRWRLAMLPEHQRQWLAQWSLAGGVALLVLHWVGTASRHERTWVADWSVVADLLSADVRSLSYQDDPPGADVRPGEGPCNYLAAYQRCIEARRVQP